MGKFFDTLIRSTGEGEVPFLLVPGILRKEADLLQNRSGCWVPETIWEGGE